MRTKYRFRDRQSAESEYVKAEQERLYTFWLLESQLPGSQWKVERISNGCWNILVITHHGHSGRELCAGAIVGVIESGQLRLVALADDWTNGVIQSAQYSWDNKELQNLRELAYKVREYVNRAYRP